MALLFITGSALLFYSTSKSFPLVLQEKVSLNKTIRHSTGAAVWIIGTVLLAQSMAIPSAIVMSLVIWMTILPMLIYSLTLYPKSWKVWGVLVTVIAIFDLAGYAG